MDSLIDDCTLTERFRNLRKTDIQKNNKQIVIFNAQDLDNSLHFTSIQWFMQNQRDFQAQGFKNKLYYQQILQSFILITAHSLIYWNLARKSSQPEQYLRVQSMFIQLCLCRQKVQGLYGASSLLSLQEYKKRIIDMCSSAQPPASAQPPQGPSLFPSLHAEGR